ncbi:hypothetical protein B0T25DRAFT_521030 [Lasiosphaeria hispida]|uniref:Uncharacterized protein n=1 Tax=Lasiosphaeria hispida TaxID=260671 RepID=A0AAJ0HBV6_9PEZI|nr:hypothetical protein B0T25DRAFT_521030 [Lasiosphaeria hispida]
MKPTTILAALGLLTSAAAHVTNRVPGYNHKSAAAAQINTAVIPASFGVSAGAGRDRVQAGSCTGANNAPIPCDCPPAPTDPAFLASLAQALRQGFFPDPSVASPIDLRRFNDARDASPQTNTDRATAMIQVLQSFSGTKGQGCPGVSFPVLVGQQRSGVLGGDGSDVGAAGRRRRDVSWVA